MNGILNHRPSTDRRRLKAALLAGSAIAFALGEAAVAQERQAAAANDSAQVQEIVVTATRRAEVLSRVPMSVAAYNQESLDKRGIRQIDDVMRFTPGVNISRFASTGATLSIRGIASSTGAGTTGIYVDDTPIQIRSLGSQPRDAIPNLFDVERVEVLRGPQGTLFGAGAQGGALRFITPRPSLDGVEVYARGELAFTDNGAPSHEAGVAIGAPIVEDQLGFRISAYYRRDGGFIDRGPYLAGSVSPQDPYVGRGQVQQIQRKNANDFDTYAFRAAITARLGDAVTVTPSLYYNRSVAHDISSAWYILSDPGNQKFVTGNNRPETNKDRFYLPALNIEWDLGFATLTSNTSKFIRNDDGVYDYTTYILQNFPENPNPSNPFGVFDKYYALSDHDPHNFSGNNQNNFNQEIRLASNNPDSRLTWVVGAYYANARQSSYQSARDTYFPEYFGISNGPLDMVVYDEELIAHDKQRAIFGEITWEVIDGLKITGGLRYAKSSFDFRGTVAGLVAGPTGFIENEGSQSEKPLTPKFSVQYQLDENNLAYFTAAKGYRIGGSNRAIPESPACVAALASIGYDEAPTAYKSDNVWSYEVGSKNSFMDGRARVAAAAYMIKWTDIIRNVPSLGVGCAYELIANLGEATSKGFELESTLVVTDGLTVGLAAGYNNIEYDETIRLLGAPEDLVREGHTLGGSPWTVSANVSYDFDARGIPAYFRGDYTYRSVNKALTPQRDPTFSRLYDPTVVLGPSFHDVRLRAGVRLDNGADVSVFVNNLLNRTRVGFGGSRLGPLDEFIAPRPRTMGVTATYRY
ncbi:TonB-dependent receptor [Phenylobacterium sp.]|jgi:iron complex outermembrane receptor protein|uniref:TonB-dependent receptor n=1 Tax=Phenylobacterium sp. TaxID=1871053 RepID=UPI0037833BDB